MTLNSPGRTHLLPKVEKECLCPPQIWAQTFRKTRRSSAWRTDLKVGTRGSRRRWACRWTSRRTWSRDSQRKLCNLWVRTGTSERISRRPVTKSKTLKDFKAPHFKIWTKLRMLIDSTKAAWWEMKICHQIKAVFYKILEGNLRKGLGPKVATEVIITCLSTEREGLSLKDCITFQKVGQDQGLLLK